MNKIIHIFEDGDITIESVNSDIIGFGFGCDKGRWFTSYALMKNETVLDGMKKLIARIEKNKASENK
jgi:hypothetical protein